MPITTFDAVVVESLVETPDTKTIVLDVGQPVSYLAGQYLMIDPHQFAGLRSVITYLEQLKGRREPPREYSMCSAPHEPLAFTVKEEVYEAGRMKYPPLLSGYLVHGVRPGDRMQVRGFAGGYKLTDEVAAGAAHIVHLCAGSGSVPNFSMLKDALRRYPSLRHTFVYSNKTADDIIFRTSLDEVRSQFPDRVRVIHTLTRDPSAPEGMLRGRVTAELLQPILAEPDTMIYMCGPAITVWDRRAGAAEGKPPTPRFLEAMQAHLDALAFPRARVKTEAFG